MISWLEYSNFYDTDLNGKYWLFFKVVAYPVS